MDEDEINIIAYNYVGYIKLKKILFFLLMIIKMMLFITKVESIGEFFSGYVSFPEVEKNTLFYMKAFCLLLL